MTTLPNPHTFNCSDTPGVFECPECPAWAHVNRNPDTGLKLSGYCLHPADKSAPVIIERWTDESALDSHNYEMESV